ncbi:PPE domain-containing protein [Mycobacterium sp.]|uniref:PPE domain-containing protein n=1 Tax=Mycobacterium sp. TaxID=1785 RepID=UPI003BAC813E
MPPEVIAQQLTSGWGPEQMQAAAVSFGNLAKAYQDLSSWMEAHSQKVLSSWSSSTSLPLQEKISQFVAQLQNYATILADSSARADAQAPARLCYGANSRS